MSEAREDHAEPVAGEVIGRSIGKILGMSIVLPPIVLVGFGLTAGWLTGRVTDDLVEGPSVVTFWGFLVGLFMLLAGPLWLASLVRRLLIRERLVLGSDRLQVVRRQDGRDVVLVQLPYDNIADVVYGVDDFSRFLKIDLKDPDDPKTFGEDFDHNKETTGHHYIFGSGYRASAATLLEKLNEKMQHQHEDRDAENRRLDQLLEKISTHGMRSLTNEEQQALKQFSDHFRLGKEKPR